LRPDQANNSQDPISKIPNAKKGWWSGSSGRASKYEVLSLSPSNVKKKFRTYCLNKPVKTAKNMGKALHSNPIFIKKKKNNNILLKIR
jgi:hypothetical protein